MQSESQKDIQRAIAAATAIIDGREPRDDSASIMVTTEHAIAAVLITLFKDPRYAAGMLSEALVPGIEQRLALYASRFASRKG